MENETLYVRDQAANLSLPTVTWLLRLPRGIWAGEFVVG